MKKNFVHGRGSWEEIAPSLLSSYKPVLYFQNSHPPPLTSIPSPSSLPPPFPTVKTIQVLKNSHILDLFLNGKKE